MKDFLNQRPAFFQLYQSVRVSTAWSLRGVAMQPKDTEERRRAIDRVNRAYADEDYDRYERLIERYCHRFGFDGDYGLFEDACTDARLFGHGIG